MKKLTDTLQVFDTEKANVVANVVLNGYNIHNSGPLGKQGAMRSFAVLKGDLWDSWNQQQILVLKDENGKEASIRIAALPVESDGYGLIEFV
ncbi:MAG: hypothetical protein AAF614_34505 [Chloroflexota bacterium]